MKGILILGAVILGFIAAVHYEDDFVVLKTDRWECSAYGYFVERLPTQAGIRAVETEVTRRLCIRYERKAL